MGKGPKPSERHISKGIHSGQKPASTRPTIRTIAETHSDIENAIRLGKSNNSFTKRKEGAKMFEDIAETHLNQDYKEAAADFFERAATIFSELNEKEKAGKLFEKAAQIKQS